MKSSQEFVAYERAEHNAIIVSSGQQTVVPDILLQPIQMFNVTVTVLAATGD